MRGCNALLAVVALGGIGAAPATPLGTGYQRLENGRVVRAQIAADTKRVAVYYGASWCGPCRAFVPELIAAYPRLRARHIEVLFVSDDTGCAAALDYARTSRMPWLLLPCDPPRRARIRALGGRALPGIVVVDRNGTLVATSWNDATTSMPRKVLRNLLE